MYKSCTASAPGKVILLGEHWVVSGSYGLAASIDLKATVRCVRRACSRPEVCIASTLGKTCIDARNVGECSGPLCGLGYAARQLLEDTRVEPLCIQCWVNSLIPIGAGLGSSAAVATAFSAAYAGIHGIKFNRSLINKAAYEAEKYNHGRPSGIDNTIASYGGYLLYKRDWGAKPLKYGIMLNALIVNTRIQRSTRKAVENFQKNLAMLGELRDRLVSLVDEIVLEGVRLLRMRALEQFGRLMYLSHGLLQGMGVSIPELDWIVYTALTHGAYGAKITGAGMGGSAIVVGEETVLSRVAEEFTRKGFEVYKVKLGVRGVNLMCI